MKIPYVSSLAIGVLLLLLGCGRGEIAPTGVPSLTNWSVSNYKPRPTEVIELCYSVNSPSQRMVGLGASLRETGTTQEYSHKESDVIVSATSGLGQYCRGFMVPKSVSNYDLAMAIWSGQPGSSIQFDTTGWLPKKIQIENQR